MHNLVVIIATTLIPSISVDEFEEDIDSLEKARKIAIVRRKLNTRSPFWGDHKSNKSRSVFEANLENSDSDPLVINDGEPTLCAVNGKS